MTAEPCPKAIVWDDGRKFNIDKTFEIYAGRQQQKCGGVGIRYICRIRNKEIRLFDEEGKIGLWKLDIVKVNSPEALSFGAAFLIRYI